MCFRIVESSLCSFCGQSGETLEHFFVESKQTRQCYEKVAKTGLVSLT